MAQIIPLSPAPNQSLTITGTVDGSTLTIGLKFAFSDMAGYWVMGISDNNGKLLLDSVPCVTGSYPAANILGQYSYLKIGSMFFVNASGSALDYASQTNLGSEFLLLWDDTAA